MRTRPAAGINWFDWSSGRAGVGGATTTNAEIARRARKKKRAMTDEGPGDRPDWLTRESRCECKYS